MSDEPLNGAIDEAARRMTDGSPDAGFRRRVMARIEADETPRRSWRAAFVLPPIAAAIAIGVFVTRGGDTTRVATPAGTVAGAARTADGVGAAGAPGTAGPSASARPENPRASARLAVAREPGPIEPGISAPARLEPIAVVSIAVAPLVVETLTPESIQIERLDPVAPIAVAPLDMTDVQRRYE